MFLTRSIRRKFTLLFALAGLMVMGLFVSGLSALYTYADTVDELEQAITHAPLRSDIVAAVTATYQPLIGRRFEGERDAVGEIQPLLAKLQYARAELSRFHQRLAKSSPVIDPRLDKNNARERLIRADEYLGRSEQRLAQETGAFLSRNLRSELLTNTVLAERILEDLPDPRDHLERRLRAAREGRAFHATSIWASGIFALALLALMLRSGYAWVVRPIRQLHETVRHVTNGDYTRRARLTGQDEIVGLAKAFNLMTQRFEEIKRDLDLQVHERSRQLIRSERLANIGILTSGLAHEINNPLNAVAMAAESLASRIPDASLEGQPPLREHMEFALRMIQQQTFRVRELTSRMLDFTRGKDEPPRLTSLTELVNEVLGLLEHLGKLKRHVVDFDRSRPHELELKGSEIRQVILNIVGNAIESMEEPGTLTIRIDELADEVLLVVKDTGCGMSPAVQEQLFEPFFTERRNGRGTGLGLSISDRIVRDHGGRIEPSSEGVGCGSTFRVHLPRAGAAALAHARRPAA